MKRKRLALTLYALTVLIAIAGFAWVTRTVLRVEEERRRDVLEAEYMAELRLALWRVDSWFGPLLALEAARPSADYVPGEGMSGHFALDAENIPERLVLPATTALSGQVRSASNAALDTVEHLELAYATDTLPEYIHVPTHVFSSFTNLFLLLVDSSFYRNSILRICERVKRAIDRGHNPIRQAPCHNW